MTNPYIDRLPKERIMLKMTLSTLCVACSLLVAGTVAAQEEPPMPVIDAAPVQAPVLDEAGLQEFTSRVLSLNQISPLQNPQYKRGTKALSYRLIDQNRRGLGEITDITIGEDGKIRSIEADVMATGFRENLSFDVTAYNANAESDAYTVTLTRSQVQKNLPQFLAGIETAAGEKAGQPITVKSLVGGRVQTNKGTQVAIVNDVLIDEKRKAAVALLLTLMGGTGRATIAVPYGDAKIERVGNKATIELSEEQARVLTNFAKKK